MSSQHNYILVDGEPVPEPDILKWSDWFERSDRKLARDEFDDYYVSTIFMGTDHNYDDTGPPILWETMVFGGKLADEQERYTSRADALRGYARMVKRVEAAE